MTEADDKVSWLVADRTGPSSIEVAGGSPSSEVATGSCAMGAREPGQDRKVAAFIGIVRVPQTAWSSPQSTAPVSPQDA